MRAAIPATDQNGVEILVENRGYRRSRNDARSCNPDYDLGIVSTCHLERERSRQLAEQRPVDLENIARPIDNLLAW